MNSDRGNDGQHRKTASLNESTKAAAVHADHQYTYFRIFCTNRILAWVDSSVSEGEFCELKNVSSQRAVVF
jgi:hypothetical protein